MKKMYLGVVLVLMVGSLFSCVSIQDKTLSPEERELVDVIGTVHTEMNRLQPFHIIGSKNLSKSIYLQLLGEAREKYPGNIDVVNIITTGTFHGLAFLPVPPLAFGIFGNFQKIRASGEVINLSNKTLLEKDPKIYSYSELKAKEYIIIGTVVLYAKEESVLQGIPSINAALVEEAVKIGGHDIINVRFDTSIEGRILAATAIAIKYLD